MTWSGPWFSEEQLDCYEQVEYNYESVHQMLELVGWNT